MSTRLNLLSTLLKKNKRLAVDYSLILLYKFSQVHDEKDKMEINSTV